MTTSEHVAYLKGLAEGLGIGKESKEDKLFSAIISVLERMAVEIDDLGENAYDLGEEIDAISDDLAVLESIVFDADESDDDFDDCCEDEGHCCCCGDEGGPILYEVSCPSCGHTITVDEDILIRGAFSCPNCKKMLEIGPELEDADDVAAKEETAE